MESAKNRFLSPGFTLVEIMVSMLIALIVMGGVYRTLSDESIHHDKSEKILDMQNNARVAMERIVRDVRRTGFLGCGGALAANTLDGAGTDATMIGKLTVSDPAVMARDMDYNTILKQLIDYPDMAAHAVGIDYLGEALGFNDNAPAGHDFYQEGTDALTLVYLSSEQPLNTAMTSVTSQVPADTAGFDNGDILYVTDCQDYSLFQNTGVVAGPPAGLGHAVSGLNNSADLKKIYGSLSPARVYKLNTSTYFLHQGDYNLCHDDTDQAIASNIEDLQFQFLFDDRCAGVACAGGDGLLTDEVWTSNLGGHPSKDVRAVRVWVLAMSDTDFTYTNTNTYDYPNSPYYSAANPFASANGAGGSPAALAPAGPENGEHRYRYLASAVVYLRNAGLQ